MLVTTIHQVKTSLSDLIEPAEREKNSLPNSPRESPVLGSGNSRFRCNTRSDPDLTADMPIVSNERVFDLYRVRRIW